MKKEDLWNLYCRKYPSFSKGGNVTLSSRGLKRIFDAAFDEGFDQGILVSKNFGSDTEAAGMDAFRDIFGGSKNG